MENCSEPYRPSVNAAEIFILQEVRLGDDEAASIAVAKVKNRRGRKCSLEKSNAVCDMWKDT